MKLFAKLATALLLVVAGATSLHAQVFNHLGAGVGIGLNGISIDVATPITRFINVHAGVDIMPGITFNADADFTYEATQAGAPTQTIDGTMELKGDLGRVQGHLIFNVYPFPKGAFYVAAGAYFGGNKLLKITGHSNELAGLSNNGNVIIGDYNVPVDKDGNVDGGLKVKNFRPYLGIGWGRAVPKRFIAFGIDLGVQFEGKPDVYTNHGTITTSITDDDNTFNKVRDALSVYPTLTFKLNFRAF